jgi:hypothetical protein
VRTYSIFLIIVKVEKSYLKFLTGLEEIITSIGFEQGASSMHSAIRIEGGPSVATPAVHSTTVIVLMLSTILTAE